MIDMHEHGSFQQLYHPGQLCRKDRETLFIISAWRLVIERHGGDRLGPAACRAAEDTRVSLQLQQRLSAGAVECSCRRCREGQWVAAVSNVEGGAVECSCRRCRRGRSCKPLAPHLPCSFGSTRPGRGPTTARCLGSRTHI